GEQQAPCAVPGTACVYAGTGERGFNIANPTADRLQSKLYFPQDVTFGPDRRAYIVDWNNHRIRRVEHDLGADGFVHVHEGGWTVNQAHCPPHRP
ncbi:MAG: hypothetical protein KY453_11900, partial [Gemmatimonadetes bacterium]|nr:hypothetical protein [Gemmatimonadota bacterium]